MRRFIALLALLPWLASAADINYTNIPLALGPVATNTVLSETNGHVARATIQQIMDLTSAQVATSNYLTSIGVALTNLDTRGWTNNTSIYGNGVGITNVNSAIYVTSASLTNTIPIGNVTAPGQIITNGNTSIFVGGAGPGSTNIVTGRIISTNASAVGVTYLDLNGAILGASGNVVEYKTNNVSKFSIDTAGNVFAGGNQTNNGNISCSGTFQGSFFCDKSNTKSYVDFTQTGIGLAVYNKVAANASFSINGMAAQTGDLQQWRNNSSAILGKVNTNGDLSIGTTITATNGFILQCKPSFTTNFTCTTNLQVYFCNGTNQVVTLPNAANVPNVIYRISVTNGWAKVIVTNATGAQTIRDGTSLSFTQIGIGNPSFISDGAHWWSASRLRAITPNAQFSCSTNIPMTSSSTSYPVTFDSTDFNNSQGITLAAGTNGLNSKMWITNSGQYEFSPSIVINFGGNNTVTTWFKKDGVNIANSATAIKGAAGGSIRCVTIPFVVSVTNEAAYEIWVQSTSTGDSLSVQAAGGAAPNDYPASPSIICPIKRISETWP